MYTWVGGRERVLNTVALSNAACTGQWAYKIGCLIKVHPSSMDMMWYIQLRLILFSWKRSFDSYTSEIAAGLRGCQAAGLWWCVSEKGWVFSIGDINCCNYYVFWGIIFCYPQSLNYLYIILCVES